MKWKTIVGFVFLFSGGFGLSSATDNEYLLASGILFGVGIILVYLDNRKKKY